AHVAVEAVLRAVAAGRHALDLRGGDEAVEVADRVQLAALQRLEDMSSRVRGHRLERGAKAAGDWLGPCPCPERRRRLEEAHAGQGADRAGAESEKLGTCRLHGAILRPGPAFSNF